MVWHMNSNPQPDGADLDADIESLARAVLENPNSAESFLRLGQRLRQIGMHAEAINAIEAAASLDFEGAWFELATVLEENRKIAEAMAIWRKRLQHLDGLKPDQDYVANASVKLPQQSHLNKELGRHAAAADLFARQGNAVYALAEFKAAVACWSMAYKVKSQS
ncbi:MAG: hypothetical protein A3H35_07135 [Betaproteobacteria bacterium RIFCSPLOWO2_02_FULL_62_17]|nr:MAG: hypothetical protein A3H35_07135 [Betaproteobacteria bacterium RIFCSPLOWO2_02_FULL_62_17]